MERIGCWYRLRSTNNGLSTALHSLVFDWQQYFVEILLLLILIADAGGCHHQTFHHGRVLVRERLQLHDLLEVFRIEYGRASADKYISIELGFAHRLTTTNEHPLKPSLTCVFVSPVTQTLPPSHQRSPLRQ